MVFALEPTDNIKIEFWAKKPGFDNDLERREFNFFLYEKEEKAQYVEEYARLILDAIRGDQTLFVSTEEIHAMWEFIDPVVEAWHEGAVKLDTYEPDTQQAPERADEALAAPPSRGSIGIIGLGKMGAGIAENLIDDGWDVTGYNRSPGKTDALKPLGLNACVLGGRARPGPPAAAHRLAHASRRQAGGRHALWRWWPRRAPR